MGREPAARQVWRERLPWLAPPLILLAFFTAVALFVRLNRPVEISYSRFKTLVAENGLAEGETLRLSGDAIVGAAAERLTGTNGRSGTSFQVRRGGLTDDDTLYRLLDDAGIEYTGSAASGGMGSAFWLGLLPLVLLLGGGLILLRFLGRGSPLAFGRHPAKVSAQEDLEVRFGDAAGIDEAVEEVGEIVDFLKEPQKYAAIGGRIPKGVLLVGPPGTGKTLLAKAVAGEAGVPFFALAGSSFVEMYVGVGASRVRDLFRKAEEKAPCIVFIDELDALGKSRAGGGGGHEEREQTLNQLLVEMDGFSPNRGVILMAATNRPETLDQALLRPGRFDRTVVVDRPDIEGRAAILRVHLRLVKVAEEINVGELARLTPGFVGADLANLVNEAALLAAREGHTAVQRHHFEEAVERVMAGLQRKRKVMTPAELRRIAYHECGHAIVAYLLPGADPVHKISIIPRGVGALGYTLQRPVEDRYLMTQSELENQIATLLGGIAAEELVYPEVSTGARNDLQRVTQLARAMVTEYGMSPAIGRLYYSSRRTDPFLRGGAPSDSGPQSAPTAATIDSEVKRIVDESAAKVAGLLERHRDALETLTARLLEREVVTGDQLREVMDATRPADESAPAEPQPPEVDLSP